MSAPIGVPAGRRNEPPIDTLKLFRLACLDLDAPDMEADLDAIRAELAAGGADALRWLAGTPSAASLHEACARGLIDMAWSEALHRIQWQLELETSG